MPHGRHIYAKSYDMTKATMCEYPKSYHVLPYQKFLLQFCDRCPSVHLTDQETDYQHSDTSPSIIFHVYNLISCCTIHGRLPFTDNKICRKCKQDTASEKSTKIYTRKELVMIETTISNFCTSLYIQEIHKLAFHIPHVQILGTNHCCGSC